MFSHHVITYKMYNTERRTFLSLIDQNKASFKSVKQKKNVNKYVEDRQHK